MPTVAAINGHCLAAGTMTIALLRRETTDRVEVTAAKVTGRWRLVIQIVSGKQIVWGGKTLFPISAVEGCVCIATGVRWGV